MTQFDDVVFQLDLGEPSLELLEYARINIGETEEAKSRLLWELKELIYERGDVTPHRMDDVYLLRFLRARNFQLDSAYKLLVKYYRYKQKNPDFHENVNPIKLTHIGDEDILNVLPYREQSGRRVMVYKIAKWNPSKYPVLDMFRATLNVLELGVLEQRAQILGGVVLFDLEGITLTHARQVTPGVAHRVFDLMVTSFPLKVSSIHIVNESWIFDIIYNIFKPLLDDRMKHKVFFHGSDMESLHNHIEPKYLPIKYGGMRPNYTYDKWIPGFKANPTIIKELRSLNYVINDEDINEII